jgi:DNA-binding MarR family transcriptional regulator
MLVLLERRGLVRRIANSTDSRARTVALTAVGKRKFREVWMAGEAIRVQMQGSLRPKEAKILVDLLKRVADALNPECVLLGNSVFRQEDES